MRNRIAQRCGAAGRLDDTLELAKRQIAGLLEQIAAVFTDGRLDNLGQDGAQIRDPVGLVARQQPAIAGHQDGRQPAPDPRFRPFRHDDCAPSKDAASIGRLWLFVCERRHCRASGP